MLLNRSAIISTFIISCFLSLSLITLYLNYDSNGCHEGSFLCTQSDICIANKYKCNNHSDCQHGEDEDSLLCTDFSGSMQHYHKVITIKNPDSELELTMPCALKNYPAKCDCLNETWLRCNNISLTKVPRNISSNLIQISMTNNNIVLSNDSFNDNLQYNKLSVLPPFVFEHQTELTFLFLQWNRIEIINEFLFADMPNLTVLNLSNNLITVIHENAFKNLLNLSDLNIANNRITTITLEILNPLKLLDKLNFGNNPITRVNSDIFKEMKDLSSLNMNGINEENIDFSSFNNLTTRLEVLYLDEFHYCVFHAQHVKLCFPNIDALNFVIRNLAVADLFMAIYLIVSMLILVFLSLDRYIIIGLHFIGNPGLKMKTAVFTMASIWVVGIIILWKHSSKFYGSNGLCYPLYIEDPFVSGWQYSAFILLLMTVLYALLFKNIKETRKRAKRISTAVEISQSTHPVSVYNKKTNKKNRKKALEEQRKEKNGTQENSLETTTDY
ncbi:relaxin receptor 2-like, partial [Aphis craccivora]